MSYKEYTIIRKSVNERFKCPICKKGDLIWIGSVNFFDYKCEKCLMRFTK